MSLRRTVSAVLTVALAPFAFAQQRPVTDNPREYTNLNVETVRGVLWSAVDGWIYALNTPLSQVIVHSNLDGVPDFTWQTLSQPTAIAEWRNDRILVVGGGTHALAIHDRNGGAILDVVQLKSEPADIVVDPDFNVAFVACQGADQLVRVDLNTLATSTIDVPAERPRFLYFDRGLVANLTDNRVYVAPFLSGNDTIPQAPTTLTPAHPFQDDLVRVVSLAGAPAQLPDEDLFVLDSSATTPTLQAAMRSAGTLLTAHGRNPYTGEYWMLNVDSRNGHPTLDTEPELNGQFAFNRVSIGTPAPGASPLPSPARVVDVDDIDPTATVAYSPTTSRAFPFGLAFHPAGYAAATASMSDRIMAFAPDGSRLLALDMVLPDGSIPRHLQFDPFYGQYLAVHCWGTNVVQICQPGVTTPVVTLSLGLDPTPTIVKQGREIWYDADRSLYGRVSCNTCHPSGKADGLAWMLSDPPHDHKDTMVTQSLLGIEDTFPYHWRGERDLLAFNGAFTGLLGAPAALTVGPGSEFEKFQAFVFSLQPAANPFEDASRAVTAQAGVLATDPVGTSAFNGDIIYRTIPTFPVGAATMTCNDCHTLPTGTSGDQQVSQVTFVPTQVSIEVAHFRELRHKDQPAFGPFSRGGFGMTHNGMLANIFASTGPFQLTSQQRFDMAAFLRQFDEGLAPAAHLAFRLSTSNATTIANLLQPQVTSGGIDVVVIGEANVSGTTKPVRWLFDRGSGNYLANESGLVPVTLAQLAPGAGPNSAIRAFVLGMPPGNGQRFALDPDNDGLIDSAETTAGTDRFNPDSDGDTFPDGYEVANGSLPNNSGSTPNDQSKPDFILTPVNGQPRLDFATSSLAKFVAETTEDALVSVTWSAPGVAQRSYLSPHFAKRHTIVLQGLEPSLTALNYTATFTLIDRAGLKSQPRTVAFNSLPIISNPTRTGIAPETIRATSFSGTRLSGSPAGTLQVRNTQVQLQLREPGATAGANVTNKVVVAQVLIRRSGTTAWQVSTNPTSPNASVVPTFSVGGLIFSAPFPLFQILPNTYVVSAPTGANGIASLDFDQTGLNPNDEVHFRIVAILKPGANPPDFIDNSLGSYSMPSTPQNARQLSFTF